MDEPDQQATFTCVLILAILLATVSPAYLSGWTRTGDCGAGGLDLPHATSIGLASPTPALNKCM